MNTNTTNNTNATNNTKEIANTNRNLRRRRPEAKKNIITTNPNQTIDNFSDSNIISDATSITSLKKLIEVATKRLEKINGRLNFEGIITRLENADFSIYERIMIFLAHQCRANNESLLIIRNMYDTVRLYATARINLNIYKIKSEYEIDTYMETFKDTFLDVITDYNFGILQRIFNETVTNLSKNIRYYAEHDYDIDFTNPFTIYMFSDCNSHILYRERFEEFWIVLHENYGDEINELIDLK